LCDPTFSHFDTSAHQLITDGQTDRARTVLAECGMVKTKTSSHLLDFCSAYSSVKYGTQMVQVTLLRRTLASSP